MMKICSFVIKRIDNNINPKTAHMEDKKDKIKKIKRTLKNGYLLLLIGIPIAILAPLIFTQFSLVNFNNTGAIGDTIGGITAPFINIIAAILVFLALRAQIDANLLIQDQIDTQENERKIDNESRQLNQYYDNLKSSIDNFEFSKIDMWSDEKDLKTYRGSEAIYKLIDAYFCSYHGNENDVKSNPKITELISMLEICEKLLVRIKDSYIHDRETLWTLTSHQFIYRIFPRMSGDFPDRIDSYDCEECDMKHGFPKKLSEPIKNIDKLICNGLKNSSEDSLRALSL